jgi:hypothetical protein
MNRLKLWLFALLVIGAAGLSLLAVTADLGGRALQIVDARLVAASTRVTASQRALQGDAGAVAALAGRDPALIHALADEGRARRPRPPGDLAQEGATQQIARAAVAAAEAELGVTLPQGARFTASQRGWIEARVEDPEADAATNAFLRAALGGHARRGFLRAGGGLAYGVAVPAGAGVLGVFVPVDAAWLAALSAGSGVDLTVAAPGLQPLSGLASGAEPLVKAAATGPGTVRDAGRLAPVPVDAAVSLGARRPLLATYPSHRVLALPLADVNGALILSAPTQPLLAPVVELEWRGLVGLALAAVLALLFGLLIGSARAAEVPAELLSAAERIERGDLEARAPWLPGKLGTVASALNRAAEIAAGQGAPAPLAPPPEASAPEPPWVTSHAASAASAAPPGREPAAVADPVFAPAPEPDRSPAPAPTLLLDASALPRAPEAAPFAATPEAEPPPARPEVAPDRAQPPVAAPIDGVSADEDHWREVFREFLRVRAECGEPTQGLTYERLRVKLASNRDALMAKYGCRTVRFQVYVKDGKTALKATPVR